MQLHKSFSKEILSNNGEGGSSGSSGALRISKSNSNEIIPIVSEEKLSPTDKGVESPQQTKKVLTGDHLKFPPIDGLQVSSIEADSKKQLQTEKTTENSAGFKKQESEQLICVPPTWEPATAFNFPVADIPFKISLLNDLEFSAFSEIQHIADGSNANVYLANFMGEKVIIKMIKKEVQFDNVAVHEFDLEHGMLARISHPNIIKVLGAGRVPRRFIVLEWLGGGSLNSILLQHQAQPGLAQRLFRKPSFTYNTLLARSIEMAEALDYLHYRCHPGATIIHRGAD
jgi:hypothetical protein